MAFEIAVKVLKGDDGKINGISFVAGAETYSEDFVSRFPRALMEGEATISVNDGEIVLDGPTFNRRGKFTFRPEPEELEGLKESVFAKSGKKLTLEPDGLMTPGFKLIIK